MAAHANGVGTETAERLAARLGAAKVLSSGSEYDAAARVWNRAVVRAPAVIVRCETAGDVQVAVQAAVHGGLTLSVLGGGHDWAGRALSGELVVDLTRMNSVRIEGDEAMVGGGATSMDVARAAGAVGLAPVTGNLGAVGITGLTLGGGYGPLTGRFGLSCDNLVGAEVVTAAGELVWTDSTHEPDLLWALAGGGGNFGVVTAIRVKLHPVAELAAGMVAFSWDQAAKVAVALGSFQRTASDALTLTTAFAPDADGKLALTMLYAWCGDASLDDDMLREVKNLGASATATVARTSYMQMLEDTEAFVVPDIAALYRTVTLGKLHTDAMSAIVTAMESRSSPLSYVVLHPFHGAGERVELRSTAFGLRRAHFVVGIYAFWQGGQEGPHQAWADALETTLRPYALKSAYPNYFGPDRPEQAAQAYGPNATRLMQIKMSYDPAGMFNATALPSQGPC